MHPLSTIPRWLCTSLLLLTAFGGARAWSADPTPPPAPPQRNLMQPPILPLPDGLIIKIADNSITIRPLTALAKGGLTDAAVGDPADPAAHAADRRTPVQPEDHTFALDKARTRVRIEVVIDERMTNTGQRIRSSQYDAGQIEDLEAGQWVRVDAVDGVATQIAIVPDPYAPRPAPLTIVKVGVNSITVASGEPRPQPGVVAGNNPPATRPVERTYATDPEKTRVTLIAVAAERPAPGGGVVRLLNTKAGSLADLKSGQLVEIRARKDAAVDIRVVPPPAPDPRPAPAAKPKASES